MKSRTYLQLLAPQLLVGASSAWLFAWSHDENAPVIPRQTNAVKNYLEGRSPAPEPTNPPVAVREPRRDNNHLLKRATETCGFRNGNKDLPLECGSGLYCFKDPAISMIDCCRSADVQDCTAAVTCLDRTQSNLWTGGNTWLCDDLEFPACVTLRYGPGTYSGYSWIACGRTADDFGTAYFETTDLVFTDPVETLVVPDPVTITITPTIEPSTSSTSSSSSTSSTAPAAATAEASSVPIGPIVGGAVGGVALIALIGFGIFFLVFRRRRQDPDVQAQQIQPQPVVSQVAQTPTPGPGPSSPSSPVSGIAANAGDIKGGYFQSTYGASPPMSPVPPYSSSPPPMQGAVSPMSMSAMTTSQFAVPTPSNGSQSPQPQMGLGVQGMQGQPQQQQQQQYYQPQPQPQQQQQQQTNQGYAYHQYGQAAELDTARGDGEVRELA
ncbi:hypothetical protein V8F06_008846 [Rhypophila decipiens]